MVAAAADTHPGRSQSDHGLSQRKSLHVTKEKTHLYAYACFSLPHILQPSHLPLTKLCKARAGKKNVKENWHCEAWHVGKNGLFRLPSAVQTGGPAWG